MEVTFRQLLGRRRAILMVAFALIPVAIAAIYQLTGGDARPEEFTPGLLDGLVVVGLLPLVALVFATAAVGSDIEDGTAVYLLAKPIPRLQIIVSKLVVSAALTAALVAASTFMAATLAMGGIDGDRVVLGFTLAVIVGSVVYSAVFVALSVVTTRALIIRLVYVFLWEGVVTSLFSGTLILSIRAYTLAIADAIVDVSPRDFDADLGAPTAIVSAIIVGVGATWFAGRRLRRFEIGETT
jgi:ABC-2 type transport system permease protein